MKQGWEYKKLGEVGTIVTGNTPSTKNEEYYSSNDYCFIKPSDLPSEGYVILKDSEYHISSKGYEVSRKLPKGSVLVSCIGLIGKTAILGVDACSNQQINSIIPKDNVNSKFLAYSILSQRFKLAAIANAPVVPLINKGDFSKIQIPLPPLAIQQSIVAELDKINEIIDLKKAQLKDLDLLAQSIFYDMFGDPIENPKGWEVKKLLEVVDSTCTISYGIVQPGDGEENGIPVVRPIDLIDEVVKNANLKKTTKEISDSYKRSILDGTEILMCVRGTTGIVSYASSELKGCNVTRGIVPIKVGNYIDRVFLFRQFRTNALQNLIAERTYGATLKQINMKDLRNLPIILPPLSLQQSFAEKIQAIESQKSAIKQSLAEAETLLASRMDYYFN